MLNVVDSSSNVTRKFPVTPVSDEGATVYALVVSLLLFPVSQQFTWPEAYFLLGRELGTGCQVFACKRLLEYLQDLF